MNLKFKLPVSSPASAVITQMSTPNPNPTAKEVHTFILNDIPVFTVDGSFPLAVNYILARAVSPMIAYADEALGPTSWPHPSWPALGYTTLDNYIHDQEEANYTAVEDRLIAIYLDPGATAIGPMQVAQAACCLTCKLLDKTMAAWAAGFKSARISHLQFAVHPDKANMARLEIQFGYTNY
jgi:hypothetical protein